MARPWEPHDFDSVYERFICLSLAEAQNIGSPLPYVSVVGMTVGTVKFLGSINFAWRWECISSSAHSLLCVVFS
jgi:hypothetical protein